MNRTHHLRPVLLAALLVPAFLHRAPGQTAAAASQAPVLVVKTARPEVASVLAHGLGQGGALPELAADAHYVMSLGAERKLQVETAVGDIGLLQLTADPGALMELFGEQVEAGKPMVRGPLTLALQTQGVAPKDVAVFVDQVFQLPQQMRSVSLHVVGDPKAVAKGLDVVLRIDAKAATWLATFLDMLQPCPEGAPSLPVVDAAMQLQVSLARDSLRQVLAPFRAISINLTNQGAEQREKATAMYDRLLTPHDGGVAAVFDSQWRGSILLGVAAPEELRQLMASEEYLAWTKGQKLQNRDLEMQVTPQAFLHRGVKVVKSRVTGGEPNAMMPDGVMESYFGVVGGYLAGTLGGTQGEPEAKALIDAVADQKVTRAPLPGGALLRLVMDLRPLFAAMQRPAAARELSQNMPTRVTVTFGKSDGALQLHVHLQ